MKTRHVSSAGWDFAGDVRTALREVNSLENNIRIINCGRGVVVLPDTNRKADCTENEIIKALGLAKKCDGLHLESYQKMEDERQLVSIQYEYDTPDIIGLTDAQIRLLKWLENRGYLSESISFHYMDKFEVEEI